MPAPLGSLSLTLTVNPLSSHRSGPVRALPFKTCQVHVLFVLSKRLFGHKRLRNSRAKGSGGSAPPTAHVRREVGFNA